MARAIPKLSYLKVWGCETLVKRDTLTKPDKLEPRSIKCIFVGYPKETMRYYFYYPPENKVYVARNAKFFENSIITQEASGSLEDLKIIQEEDTHPFIDISLNLEDDDQEIDEPQSDINPIRKSSRTRRPTDRLCLYVDAEEHELGDLGASTPPAEKTAHEQNIPYASAIGSIMYAVRCTRPDVALTEHAADSNRIGVKKNTGLSMRRMDSSYSNSERRMESIKVPDIFAKIFTISPRPLSIGDVKIRKVLPTDERYHWALSRFNQINEWPLMQDDP
ncbi:hypothetical protein Tco_0284799 [Tanacetum coccineum]